ncbi:MAG: dynamin family protein [Clostridium sp.]|nr:dynamin family protein [Clostridium sp.]
MNSSIKSTIDKFLIDVSTAGESIGEFSRIIDDKDKNIHKIIEDFNNKLQVISVDEENAFASQLNDTLNQYKEKSNIFLNLVNTYINGKEFINQFEKSVLFVVFGNVNVGKSSIGNQISGSTEAMREYSGDIPDHYVYDFANNNGSNKPEKMDKSQFEENCKEETSTIQYYTLNNGLTWVDSPGIHSINGENEALAKKYVDYADLVVFVMSSSSPAKYDEFLELTKLMDKKKPLLVIINKSDRYEKDEIDGQIVKVLKAKYDADRNKQEKYVNDLFENANNMKCIQSVDSISISIKLARQALSNDDNDEFISSGMPKFYERLGLTLKNDALDLKMKAPRQRINSLIDDILNGFNSENENHVDGIIEMKQSFLNIKEKINDNINMIKELEKSLLKEVRIKSMPQIDMEVSRMSAKLQAGEDTSALKNNIESIVIDKFNEIIQKEVSKILIDFKHNNVQQLNIGVEASLEAKYEKYTYTEYSLREVERNPNGIIEHIGSWLGKKYTDIKTSKHDIEEQVLVGDNSSIVIENILMSLENNLSPVVTDTLNNIIKSYFGKEKEFINIVLDELSSVEQKLKNEFMEI